MPAKEAQTPSIQRRVALFLHKISLASCQTLASRQHFRGARRVFSRFSLLASKILCNNGPAAVFLSLTGDVHLRVREEGVAEPVIV
jgi:hypothetical protein